MNRHSLAAGTIGVLVILVLVSAGFGAWVLLRPKPAPADLAPDPFAIGFIGMDEVRAHVPIPVLEQAPDPDTQRARQFHLVTVDFKGTVGELLDEVRNQTDLEFQPGENDLARLVSVVAKAWPVIRVLNEAGLEPDRLNVALHPSSGFPSAKYADGIRLSFSVKPWAPDGKPQGWIVQIDDRIDLPWSRQKSTVTWDIGSVESGAALPLEKCGKHSPSLVYVANPDPGPLTVKIRGARSWYLDAPIEFRPPKEGDTWKGHGFSVTLRWPDIVVRSERPLPAERMERCLTREDVHLYISERERGYDTMGIGGGGGGGGRYGGRFGGREKVVYAWCGCVNAPAPWTRPEVKVRDSIQVLAETDRRPLGDYECIQLDFRALIEEEFEVISDPLPTK